MDKECKYVHPNAECNHLSTRCIRPAAKCIYPSTTIHWDVGLAMADHIRGTCISLVAVRTLVWFPLLFCEISCSRTF